VAFPLHTADGGVNRLYAFQPGDGYREGDPRHQNDNGEMLFCENVIIAHYPAIPERDGNLIGVLPKGTWRKGDKGLYGRLNGGVYAAVYMERPYTIREESDRLALEIEGEGSWN